MPSIARASKPSSAPRHKADYYPTIQPFADGHARVVIERFGGLFTPLCQVLDVGVGTGVYGNALAKTSKKMNLCGVDIDTSKLPALNPYDIIYEDDFMTSTMIGGNFDIIIGNPPYYAIQDFFEKAISCLSGHGVVSFLVKGSYLESAIRFSWFKKHRPYSVWNAVNRPIKNHAENYVIVNYRKVDWNAPTKMGWLLSSKKEFDFYE